MPSFEENYPALARLVKLQGWIEVGLIPGSPSMIQALDEGGYIWQGDESYASLDDAFRAADEAVAAWWRDVMGEP
jgi:hypothetical protein